MDSFATAVSLSLQHGVPLKVLCEKFAHTRFEPSGWTGSEQIGFAKSIMDYIFRWLQLRFLSGHQLSLFTGLAAGAQPIPGSHLPQRPPAVLTFEAAKLRNAPTGRRHHARTGCAELRAGANPSFNMEDRGIFGMPDTSQGVDPRRPMP